MNDISAVLEQHISGTSSNFEILLAIVQSNRTAIRDLITLLASTEGVNRGALRKIANEMDQVDEEVAKLAEKALASKPLSP